MAHNTFLFFFCLIFLAPSIQVSYAVTFTVTNTAANTRGGARFIDAIGEDYTKLIANSATDFIWTTFNENDPIDRKNTQDVAVSIDDIDGAANTLADHIRISASYIEGYINDDMKKEITGVLYHEMTHVWQWDGNRNANGGLIEGIADYVRLKAGYAVSHWVKPGQGKSWDQGYDVTARFLDYCDSLRNGFVADLNKKMRNGYDDSYFNDLLWEDS